MSLMLMRNQRMRPVAKKQAPFVPSRNVPFFRRSTTPSQKSCVSYHSQQASMQTRWNSSSSSTNAVMSEQFLNVERPTAVQLRNHFIKSAVPMIGFGLMDQTVMLQVGNSIDCTIGVTFGLSTLTAAAFGQICSDAAGILFGGTVERIASYFGLPRTNFSPGQRSLALVKRVGLAGQLVGVVFGCCLGLLNLLFIDTQRSSTLKLQAMSDEQEFAFEVEASNAIREDATVLTVRGPDVDGLLASMTAALTAKGCSLVELHAAKAKTREPPAIAATTQSATTTSNNDTKEVSVSAVVDTSSNPPLSSPASPTSIIDIAAKATDDNTIEDVFVVVNNRTKEQVDDDDLDDLASALLEATFHPINVRSFKAQAQQLEEHNQELQARIQKLEKLLLERQIKVVPSSRKSAIMATSANEDEEGENDRACGKEQN